VCSSKIGCVTYYADFSLFAAAAADSVPSHLLSEGTAGASVYVRINAATIRVLHEVRVFSSNDS